MANNEIYYEMLWDCAVCNTKGLLGDSHRHCPTCGAAQDPAKRYFPKPGEEVEAKQHQFVGADWSCAYCNSPNSASAAHCTNCGAGQDGTKPVALVADAAAAAAPKPPATGGGALRWVLAAVGVVLVIVMVLFFSKHETKATVAQRSWLREIQIEQMSSVPQSAWCDGMPMGAYSITRNREERSSRQIEVGKDCHDERSDKGDGTFTKHQVCTPRYRREPIYDDRCHFQLNQWVVHHTVKADAALSATPVWPTVGPLRNQFNALGSERVGARSESYTLSLASGSKVWTCKVPESIWSRYTEGSTAALKVRLTGGADCDSLK